MIHPTVLSDIRCILQVCQDGASLVCKMGVVVLYVGLLGLACCLVRGAVVFSWFLMLLALVADVVCRWLGAITRTTELKIIA